MAQYSRFVLKVPLNPKQTNKLWPMNSPHFYPLDYRTDDDAGTCLPDIHSVDELKQRLVQVWCILDLDIINIAIDRCCKTSSTFLRRAAILRTPCELRVTIYDVLYVTGLLKYSILYYAPVHRGIKR